MSLCTNKNNQKSERIFARKVFFSFEIISVLRFDLSCWRTKTQNSSFIHHIECGAYWISSINAFIRLKKFGSRSIRSLAYPFPKVLVTFQSVVNEKNIKHDISNIHPHSMSCIIIINGSTLVSTLHIWFKIIANKCFKRKNRQMRETKEKSECNIASGCVCCTSLDNT